jgi:hypothetical protein
MTTDFTTDTPKWVVLTELIELISVKAGQQFTSNQECVVFDNEAEALALATEIGWEPPESNRPQLNEEELED